MPVADSKPKRRSVDLILQHIVQMSGSYSEPVYQTELSELSGFHVAVAVQAYRH